MIKYISQEKDRGSIEPQVIHGPNVERFVKTNVKTTKVSRMS